MLSLENVRELNEQGLHSNVQCLVGLLLSLPDYRTPERAEFSTISTKYQLSVYYGDALFADEQYKRAERCYGEALRVRRQMVKLKPKDTSIHNFTSEVEVKFKMYNCHMKLREFRDAIAVLEGIQLKQRTPKVNMALAKLYRKQGMERSAITCYKEVLRVCPFALEAAISLFYLGVSLQEVTTLLVVTSTSASLGIPDCITQYIKGHSIASAGKHLKAAQVFKNLEHNILPDNVDLLCCQAEAFWKAGDKGNALSCYQRVRALDPNCLQGMDIYSQILADNASLEDLEILATDLTHVSQIKTEPWVAMGQYCACTNRKTRAVYFAQKAHMIDTRNVQALILKASLLQSLNKRNEALIHYREAIRLAPSYFEAYYGLVHCYLAAEQHREAMTLARNAHKTIGATPRTLTLCAMVLVQDPQTKEKAKSMVEKALASDPSCLAAIYILAEILMEEKNFDQAIELLQKQIKVQRSARLHQLLGDCFKKKGQLQEALDHYTKALNISPGDVKALEGFHSIERDPSNSSEFELSVLGLPAENNEYHEDSVEGDPDASIPDQDIEQIDWLH